MNQKQLILYAGIGLAVSGVVTIIMVYQGLVPSDAADRQNAASQSGNEFQLEEVHANPKLVMHIHALLEVRSEEGERFDVPAEIGIAPELWHDHSLDEFGPSRALLAPLHTHDTSGTIHIESVVMRNYTLGEFLSIWGVDKREIIQVATDSGEILEDYENYAFVRNEKLTMTVK